MSLKDNFYTLAKNLAAGLSQNRTVFQVTENPIEAAIKTGVEAVNNKDFSLYTQTLTNVNRNLITAEPAFESMPGRPPQPFSPDTSIFQEESMRLKRLKLLPRPVGLLAAGVTEREKEKYPGLRVYYYSVLQTVKQESSWLFNGENFRVAIVVKEGGVWRIARVSVPNLGYIIEKGYGFGTPEEQQALRLEKNLLETGIIFNNENQVIGVIATPEEAIPAPGLPPLYAPPRPPLPAMDRAPANIKVYLSRRRNTASVPFATYIANVLPNEWECAWHAAAPESVRAGAMAIKMYGWYFAYRPKWQFAPYYASVMDNTQDQVYIPGSQKDFCNRAIQAVQGFGMKTSTQKFFVPEYRPGAYNARGKSGGLMYQNGTKFLAEKMRKNWQDMCRYYYDLSPKTDRKVIVFFSH